jgi:hypothetical protein
MSENEPVFVVKLGDRTWNLPKLPWGVVRKVQPPLLRQARHLAEGDEAGMFRRFDEGAMARQTEAISIALRHVDPDATVGNLDAMHFTLGDLTLASIEVLRACGLDVDATVETTSRPSEVENGPDSTRSTAA